MKMLLKVRHVFARIMMKELQSKFPDSKFDLKNDGSHSYICIEEDNTYISGYALGYYNRTAGEMKECLITK